MTNQQPATIHGISAQATRATFSKSCQYYFYKNRLTA
ncbi:hypothetical protein barba126A_phanotate51 [Rheinheimera phage vB_RspM_barba_12-6A]|nr:hypothetical protein barba109A_phanotate2 [Rheinheimera phage vB_RspM_barba_10-9A]QNO02160.1 hypothetical protein barba109B_phanotate2 [Rheinheimera phage vB_RspM_barba_10-9B]QNO02326.1 hypothetical protein barba109C_phanotate5 [Rheinheimera phage vB_RspM_barba_10-9C]QNO02644.1 hypothetical protein barba109D_phanotate160 [Rheinheimera phage vB_RspM_barba_10-9D]QNO02746.1 hypothetical protein barba109E_phanotate98 [Rheinheimera phage vB_RspM_barba_10-9E]QNO02973.1 hypothetical protein barba1